MRRSFLFLKSGKGDPLLLKDPAELREKIDFCFKDPARARQIAPAWP